MLQVRENEISPRKWSGGTAHLRTFRGSIGCKKCTLLAAMLLYTYRVYRKSALGLWLEKTYWENKTWTK